MALKIVNSLSESEYVLVRETAKAQMADLDEDELIELHARIRRARNKYVTLYRRAGAAKVKQKGGRGSGKAANTRNATKAEVFEDALSRVSRQLAVLARRSARELKDERLAFTRSDSPSSGDSQDDVAAVRSRGKARGDTTRESPGRKKYEASTRAAGARRQAKKDQR
jgi:hypothetical protein